MAPTIRPISRPPALFLRLGWFDFWALKGNATVTTNDRPCRIFRSTNLTCPFGSAFQYNAQPLWTNAMKHRLDSFLQANGILGHINDFGTLVSACMMHTFARSQDPSSSNFFRYPPQPAHTHLYSGKGFLSLEQYQCFSCRPEFPSLHFMAIAPHPLAEKSNSNKQKDPYKIR